MKKTDDKGRFLPGRGGRQRGARNLIGKKAKQSIFQLITSYTQNEIDDGVGNLTTRLEQDLELMAPGERVAVMLDLYKYLVPVPKDAPDVAIQNKIEQPLQFTFKTEKTYLHPEKWKEAFKKEDSFTHTHNPQNDEKSNES
jgi:hypothetical protein